MKKQTLNDRIRGWFPQEPISILPRSVTQDQTPKTQKWLTPQNVFLASLVLAGYMCFLTYLSDSWIKFTLIGATLAVGGLLVVSSFKAKRVLKATKVALAAVLIIVICFTATENYMFNNAGTPLTISPQQPDVSFTNEQMLNASLRQIVQNIESTQTFRFLEFEHGDNIIPVGFELWPYNGQGSYGGFLGVCFYSLDDNTYFHVYTNKGNQYIVEPGVCDRKPDSPQNLSEESINQDIRQIECLGIGWFNNRALELAYDRNPDLPSIDATGMAVFIGGFGGNYTGMVVQTVGFHHLPPDDINAPGDEGMLISEFAVNGTSTYLWVPEIITYKNQVTP